MYGLGVDCFAVELGFADQVSDFDEMERLTFLSEDEVDLVAKCSWIDVSPGF